MRYLWDDYYDWLEKHHHHAGFTKSTARFLLRLSDLCEAKKLSIGQPISLRAICRELSLSRPHLYDKTLALLVHLKIIKQLSNGRWVLAEDAWARLREKLRTAMRRKATGKPPVRYRKMLQARYENSKKAVVKRPKSPKWFCKKTEPSGKIRDNSCPAFSEMVLFPSISLSTEKRDNEEGQVPKKKKESGLKLKKTKRLGLTKTVGVLEQHSKTNSSTSKSKLSVVLKADKACQTEHSPKAKPSPPVDASALARVQNSVASLIPEGGNPEPGRMADNHYKGSVAVPHFGKAIDDAVKIYEAHCDDFFLRDLGADDYPLYFAGRLLHSLDDSPMGLQLRDNSATVDKLVTNVKWILEKAINYFSKEPAPVTKAMVALNLYFDIIVVSEKTWLSGGLSPRIADHTNSMFSEMMTNAMYCMPIYWRGLATDDADEWLALQKSFLTKAFGGTRVHSHFASEAIKSGEDLVLQRLLTEPERPERHDAAFLSVFSDFCDDGHSLLFESTTANDDVRDFVSLLRKQNAMIKIAGVERHLTIEPVTATDYAETFDPAESNDFAIETIQCVAQSRYTLAIFFDIDKVLSDPILRWPVMSTLHRRRTRQLPTIATTSPNSIGSELFITEANARPIGNDG